ncbi:MAG TPA: hypothetical protein VFW40_03760, partial [Capsulimonadaceae bacterium]|nr:hypothetical protein [Capsulimonadaceae bacterium]
MYRTLLIPVAIAVLFFTSGCAKFPSGGGSGTGPELIITMSVAGSINANDFYFVVFDVSNDPLGNNGPVPVIAPPWGNGFVAAKVPPNATNAGATSFVEFSSGPGYQINTFGPNTNLQNISVTGVPVQSTAPGGSSPNTLQFTVLLS